MNYDQASSNYAANVEVRGSSFSIDGEAVVAALALWW
jgi:hypothetical protein